jgi:tetratricopeptide (TPR) repeat protein
MRLADGDRPGARKALETALEAAPSRTSTLLLLASVLELENRPEEVTGVYERVLREDPENPVAANNLAMIYSRDETRLPEALRLAEIAVRKAPENPYTRDTLGWVQYKMGSWNLAARNLEQAREALPEHPEITYHLGAVYAKLGKKKEAVELLTEALESPQKGDWAFDAGQTLRELQGSNP